MGTGKPRSKLGLWLDERGITQKWLMEKTGLNKNTISKIASDSSPPKVETMKKILKVLREIDKYLKVEDFWKI